MSRALLLFLLAFPPHLVHGGVQSALHPKGENSREIAELAWVMTIGGSIIFVLVMAMTIAALFGPPRLRALISRNAMIIGGGIAFPLVVLTALLTYSLLTAASMVRSDAAPALRIAVDGELWWWRVRYLDARGAVLFETANDIRIPAGQEVAFSLTSSNVIHSFWVPSLAGKIDMIPGHVNRLRLRAEAPGLFRGQCAEYCGAQHANMAFHVIALDPHDFATWLAAQQRPAGSPATPIAVRGRDVFLQKGCAQCHTVRGTPASGRLGPDLTHVGSRTSLAAGMLPNVLGAFGGWIAASQHIKPGNRMPSFDELTPEDLRAVSAYMESLQ